MIILCFNAIFINISTKYTQMNNYPLEYKANASSAGKRISQSSKILRHIELLMQKQTEITK